MASSGGPGQPGPRTPPDRAPRRHGGSAEPPRGFRHKLRRDPFLFGLCLLFLVFTTSAFAVGWRLFGDPMLLVLAVACVPPAFVLFYLRDGSRT